MQNRHRRGSYVFVDNLNRIAARGQEDPPGTNYPNEIIEDFQNNENGINRQRTILEYFARRA